MSTGTLSSGKGNFDGGKAVLGSEGGPCCCSGMKCVQKWTLEWICNADDPDTGLPTGAGSDPVAGAKLCVPANFDMSFKQVSRNAHSCTFEGYLPLGSSCTTTANCTDLADAPTPSKATGCLPAFRTDCATCGDFMVATISGAEDPSGGGDPAGVVNGTYDLARFSSDTDRTGCGWSGFSEDNPDFYFTVELLSDGDSCGYWAANAFCNGCENGMAFGSGCYSAFYSFDVASCPQDARWSFDPILYYGDGGVWVPDPLTYRACTPVGTLVIS